MLKIIGSIVLGLALLLPAQPKIASADVSGYLTLTSPTGGEVYAEGENIRITWNASANINTVAISIKSQSGDANEWITSGTSNTGYYDWTAEAVAGPWSDGSNTKFYIEITGGQTGVGTLPDQESGMFTIYSSQNAPAQSCTSCINFDKAIYGVGDSPKLSITGASPNTDIYWYSIQDGLVKFGHLSEDLTQILPSKTSYETDGNGKFNKTLSKLKSSDAGKWEYLIKVGNVSSTVKYTVSGTYVPEPSDNPANGVGSNVKTTDGTIWFLTDGNCRSAYTSGGAYLSYGFNSWTIVRDATAADMAISICSSNNGFTLPREGKILCSDRGTDQGTCYLISGGKKNGFTSEAVFNSLGFSFSNTTMADVSWMGTGSNISDGRSAHLSGVIINNNGTLQIVTSTGLAGFPNMTIFDSWGFSLNDLVIANQADKAKTQDSVLKTRTAGKLNP